jgi:REP element-mobilizing transposase RayT
VVTHRAQQHRLRYGRYSAPGQIYLVTSVTRARLPLFSDQRSARIVVRSLIHSDRAEWSRTFAYVVMPDHLHWLFELGQAKTLDRLMCSINGFTSRKISRNGIAHGGIWQDGYHDRAIRDFEDLRAISRYIVANPLRARLCEEISDYPHWDAVWLTGGRDAAP